MKQTAKIEYNHFAPGTIVYDELTGGVYRVREMIPPTCNAACTLSNRTGLHSTSGLSTVTFVADADERGVTVDSSRSAKTALQALKVIVDDAQIE